MQLNQAELACFEITNALAKIYGRNSRCFKIGGFQAPSDRHTNIAFEELDLSEDYIFSVQPLDCVKIFESNKDFPHWHYITFGFSDLYSDFKENENSGFSGYGFELTIRLKKGSENAPPLGPVVLLRDLAKYVFSTGNVFRINEHIPLSDAVIPDSKVTIKACALTRDPELGTINTDSGKIEMLQLVGLTTDEHKQLTRWDSAKFIDLLAVNNPLLIMDPFRRSICEDAEVQRHIDTSVREQGSTTGASYVDMLEIFGGSDHIKLRFDTPVIEIITEAIKGRILFGRDFQLHGPENSVVILRTRDKSKAQIGSNDSLIIDLTAEDAKDLSDCLALLESGHTFFPALPNLELIIVPTPKAKA